MTMAQNPVSLWPDPRALGAVTDLYQLMMMAGYMAKGVDATPATFELFVRRLPAGRAYLVFAGLEQVVADLGRLAFSPEQVEAIRELPGFWRVDRAVIDRLRDFRFSGDLWSASEGTIVFPGEPLVRIEAPLAEAQWIETYLIASLNYPTLVASKAARIVGEAGGRRLYDFGARRGHGPQAGMLAARAAYLAGFDGTSLVEAGRRLGMPIVGTMAHSWIQAFPTELEAFQAFADVFGSDATTLLVDTYDTEEGIRLAAGIDPPVRALRLDSGDLDVLSRRAREILDERGRAQTQILASGDLDEFRVRDLVAASAPIDAFGIGTELITSRDAPALSMVYKLVALGGRGRVKKSAGKRTYPMGKNVHRLFDGTGRFLCDRVTRSDEAAEGLPLLERVMTRGEWVGTLPSLDAIRHHCRRQWNALPERLRALESEPSYPVEYSDALRQDAIRLGL
jgi:nicotinate phosphoribosyltransferase